MYSLLLERLPACRTTVGASEVRDFETVPIQIRTEPSWRIVKYYFNRKSVKDGLAVVEQGEHAGTPSPPALHLHIARFFHFKNMYSQQIQIDL